jgi:hypothetical protein
MTDKIKTPEDLLAFLNPGQTAASAERSAPIKRGIVPRMFGHSGTFRDTGARLNHVENKRGPQSCVTEEDNDLLNR